MNGKALSLIAQIVSLLLAGLLAAAPARADVWYGSWDPQFGVPFVTSTPYNFAYNLGWGGGQGGSFVNVTVNAPCTAPLGGGTISNGCGATVTSLAVNLYDSDAGQTPVYNQLNFTPGSLTIDSLRYNAAGRLIGISTTTESNYIHDGPTVNIGTSAGTDAYFAIQFVLDGLPCLQCGVGEFFAGNPLPTIYSGPVLYAGRYIDCNKNYLQFCEFSRSDVASYPAVISFTPEPASLALIAGGLLAAAAGARRRRAARSRA